MVIEEFLYLTITIIIDYDSNQHFQYCLFVKELTGKTRWKKVLQFFHNLFSTTAPVLLLLNLTIELYIRIIFIITHSCCYFFEECIKYSASTRYLVNWINCLTFITVLFYCIIIYFVYVLYYKYILWLIF